MIVKRPIPIKVDNKSAISFQHNSNPDSKMKGVFDMRKSWAQDLMDNKQFVAVKIDTAKNLADLLTKPLEAKVRNKLDEELMGQKQAAIACCL